MDFDQLLKEVGSFRKLFQLASDNGLNVEEQVELAFKAENKLFERAGFKVVKVRDGYAEITFPISEDVKRRGNIVHGGIIMFAMDNTGGLAVMTRNDGNDQVTIELKANFLEPLIKGPFRAVGKVVRSGRNIAVAEMEVFDSEGKLCAKGMGTWFYIYR
jgi:uncharacterized protein (TIGR00369 family)